MKRFQALIALVLIMYSGSVNAASPAGTFSSKWTLESVDRAAPGDRMTDLKLGADGLLHLVYTGCSDEQCKKSELFYATKKVGSSRWSMTSVDHDGDDTGWFPSLVLNPRGGAHILYANHEAQELRHAVVGVGGEWSSDRISKGRGGWWTSSAISGESLYMAHTLLGPQWDTGSLEVGTFTNGKWSFETVDKTRNAGWFTSMAIGKSGLPIITETRVLDQPYGFLVLAEKQPDGGWRLLDLDSDSSKSHVAVDSKGFIHIVYTQINYQVSQANNLVYATNSPDGEWKRTIVDTLKDGDAANFPRIAIDGNDGLHVVYEFRSHDLKYARNFGNGWEFSMIDTLGNSIYPWIIAARNGDLHLSYEKNGMIHYGICPGCSKP